MLLLLPSLMFCGLDGEINVYVNVIYFDVHNFVSVVGVLRLRVWDIRCEMGVDEACLCLVSLFMFLGLRIIFNHIYNDIYDRKKKKKRIRYFNYCKNCFAELLNFTVGFNFIPRSTSSLL